MNNKQEITYLQHSLKENCLFINPVRHEIIYSSGHTSELINFYTTMVLEQNGENIRSFAGNISYQEITKPMILYRTGGPGRYWTPVTPLSPWQSMIDLAMPYSLYPESMKNTPNWHPANQGVLMYEVQPGEIIARGIAAPQGPFPGGTEQIYLAKTPKTGIRSMSWEQWHSYNPCSLTYRGGCKTNQTVLYHLPAFKISGEASSLLPIKVWDTKTITLKSRSCQIKIPDRTIQCTPVSYKNSQLPACKQVHADLTFSRPEMSSSLLLKAFELYNRIEDETNTYPTVGVLAHTAAITADYGMDILSFAGGTRCMPANSAMALVTPLDMICNFAIRCVISNQNQ